MFCLQTETQLRDKKSFVYLKVDSILQSKLKVLTVHLHQFLLTLRTVSFIYLWLQPQINYDWLTNKYIVCKLAQLTGKVSRKANSIERQPSSNSQIIQKRKSTYTRHS